MKSRLLSLLPSRERLAASRWLRWLGPYLHHPRLWHLNRRGLALGLALGVFFGFLIPVAQIPASATLAVLLRAHLPAAVASTLVTNPVTFGPVYFGAYKLGEWVLDTPQDARTADGAQALAYTPAGQDTPEGAGLRDELTSMWAWMTSVGKPLVVGLMIVATVAAVFTYTAVHLLWIGAVHWRRRRRVRRGRAASGRSPVA